MPVPQGPTFSGARLDRAASERADPAWAARMLEDPGARAVLASRDGVLVEDGLLVRRPMTEMPAAEPIVLGLEDGSPLFGLDLDPIDADTAARLARGTQLIALREAGAMLPHAEGGLAAYLVALLNWHRRHRFCSTCGAGTVVAQAGHSRQCPRCRAIHFPRTDPVVIMLVESDGRLLLGRRPVWPKGRYSVLAGFVAPGESVEEAVVREVREESGIEARDVSFVSSQPWPFPASLMLGFEARSPGGDPAPRDGELEDVRWFSRDAVLDAANGDGELALPPPVSIARYLIDRWIATDDYGIDAVGARRQARRSGL
jgi:NAD+ diphosphatase